MPRELLFINIYSILNNCKCKYISDYPLLINVLKRLLMYMLYEYLEDA